MINNAENLDLEARIVEAAKRKFIERGFDQTSMSEIAAEAGINRTALHYYYRTKERLFGAVFGDIVGPIVRTVPEIVLRKDLSVAQMVEQLIDVYYGAFKVHPELPLFMVREQGRDFDRIIEIVRQLNLIEQLKEAVCALEQAMEQGRIRKLPLRRVFLTFYGQMLMPLLMRNVINGVMLGDDESFVQFLQEWKGCVVEQMCALLEVRE